MCIKNKNWQIQNKRREQLLYTCDTLKDIDDEKHFFIYYNKNSHIRINSFKKKLEKVYKYFTDDSTLQKIKIHFKSLYL